MSIQQPQNIDHLNSPDHSLSHRVFANDNEAPVKKIVVDSNGDSFFGDYDGGNRTKIDSGGVVTLEGTAKRWLTIRPEVNIDEINKQTVPIQGQRGVFFGYSMPVYNNDHQELFINQEVPGRWDGVSNFVVHIIVALSQGEDIGDKFQFKLSWEHDGGEGEVIPDTSNDVPIETTILENRNEAFDVYELEFTIDYDIDGEGNEIVEGEIFAARLQRIAASSLEATGNILVVGFDVHYQVDKIFKAT